MIASDRLLSRLRDNRNIGWSRRSTGLRTSTLATGQPSVEALDFIFYTYPTLYPRRQQRMSLVGTDTWSRVSNR